MPWEAILAKVPDVEAYQIEFGNRYNVEVQILDNTEHYVRVVVDVDHGNMPTSAH
jgi:hypothetical protein